MKIYLLLILSVMSLFAYSSALPSVCNSSPYPFREQRGSPKHMYYTFARPLCVPYFSSYRYPNLNQFQTGSDCVRACQIPYEQEMKKRTG